MLDNFVGSTLLDLDKRNKSTSLYTLYDILTDLVNREEYVEIDNLIEYFIINIESTSIHYMIGILTITAWCKSKLSLRENYFDLVKSEILYREPDDDINQLLAGL
jgi:hypothetical protein